MSKITKIAFFETTKKQEIYITNKLSGEHNLFFSQLALGEDIAFLEKVYDAEIICVFVGSNVNKSVIESFPNLKAICTMSTGFDHIDTEFAKSKNIAVCTVPTYGQNTVAEHAMSLILAISRKLIVSNEKIKKGKFDSKKICGFDLKNKNISIIGCGNIGKHLAKMCHGFEMNISIYDIN
ncbi:hydroxyacid dehydrogenase, partial [Patescibacteria group bacterium]|nr:hydroxyacid dehydrogenase [Patescibacteria group bacterium]